MFLKKWVLKIQQCNFIAEETPQVHQAIEANTAPTMQDVISEEKQAEPVPVDSFDPMSM